MISLIKDELKKIFKKKFLYVLLIITIAFCIFSNVMNNVFKSSNDMYSGLNKKLYEMNLEIAKEDNDTEYIRECESYLKAYEIAQKYEKGSWQRNIIQNKLQQLINDMLRAEADKDEAYETLKEDYEKVLSNIENGNWRVFAEEELKECNEQIEDISAVNKDDDTLEVLKFQKQVAEWRLEKNIDYGDSALNSYLENWLLAKNDINSFENTNNPSYQQKVQNERSIETVAICEYAIENGINDSVIRGGTYNLEFSTKESASSSLIDSVNSFNFFVIVAIVVIAGTIVSEEFNKGTIKLLLVRPYKRLTILISKFITSLILLVISIVAVIAIQAIVGGFAYGFDTYGLPVLVYNFNTNTVQTMGTIGYLLLSTVCLLPKFILLMTLAFAISTIFVSSPIAIAIPLIGMMGEEIINMLVTSFEKARFLVYFVTPNWDLNIFTFGKLPTYESITLPFSIAVCLVYFVIMVTVSMLVFKKRDIKNI